MSITTYSDFTTSYLVKNGMVSNEANLNKAPIQLKTEIDILNNIKQENLVSGTNIKTINNNSILGSGNITLASDWDSITAKPTTLTGYGITDVYTKTQTDNAINTSIENLIDLAPATLDTLGEIATKLVDDESVVNALITTVSEKQAALVSGTNIKTINGTSVLGSGDIVTTQTTITGNAGTATTLQTARTINGVSFDGSANITITDNTKQATLVSGTNIKTINGTSVLGSGDITISSGATLADDVITDSSFYPVFTSSTSGNMSTASVSSTKLFFNPSTGTLNATQFNAFSDERLKENVVTINDALTKVTQLRGVNYNNKDDKNKVLKMGVIAQEVQKIIPEVINDSEELLTVNYNSMIGLLIESIKELNNKVQFLQSVIDGKV